MGSCFWSKCYSRSGRVMKDTFIVHYIYIDYEMEKAVSGLPSNISSNVQADLKIESLCSIRNYFQAG